MTNSGEAAPELQSRGAKFWEGLRHSALVIAGGIAGTAVVGTAMGLDRLLLDDELAEAYQVDGPVARAVLLGTAAVWGAVVVFKDIQQKENTVQ